MGICSPIKKKPMPKITCEINQKKNKLLKVLHLTNIEKIKIAHGLFVQGYIGNPFDKYEIISEIGEGSFGRVLKVKEKTGEIFRAMKIIKKKYNQTLQEDENFLKKEVHILRKLDHPNIIKIFEFFNSKYEFHIISEFCEGGELFDHIIKSKNFSEKKAKNIMKQIFSAVHYCHKNQIIHRDLKPENIVIEEKEKEKVINNVNINNEDDSINIKIIDFGTADIFKKNKLLSLKEGTPYYMAPEVIDGLYNEKCDIWSCGVILYILLCGSPPFYGKNDKEIFNKIKTEKIIFTQKIWENVSEQAKDLIKKLLNRDYKIRPTAEESLKDDWFNLLEVNNHNHNDYSTKYNHNYNGYNCNSPIKITPHSRHSKHSKHSASTKLLFEENAYASNNTINNIALKEALFNLKNFRAERKLQSASLYFMVRNLLSNEEVKLIREIFTNFDTDKDGRLTKEEILAGCNKANFLNFSKEEIENLMNLVDIDKNGYIEYQEFIAATCSKKKILTEFNLRKSFDIFDRDKDGLISAEEMRLTLDISKKENELIWNEIIMEIDSDGDGFISFEEFKGMMYNLISSV